MLVRLHSTHIQLILVPGVFTYLVHTEAPPIPLGTNSDLVTHIHHHVDTVGYKRLYVCIRHYITYFLVLFQI